MRNILLRPFPFCFVMAFTVFTCQAQFAENISATFKDGNATITYDLNGVKAGELYSVDVYASHNKFSSPLSMVSGDVGKNIKDGKGKVIIWRAAEETNNYTDTIIFRLKVNLIYQPLEFINPKGGSIRRGHAIIIEWKGGLRTGQASTEKELELFKGTERVASLGKIKIWQHTWQIPNNLKKGGGYTFHLSGEGESLVSNTFRVKSKTPFLLKLSPLVLVAAIIPFLGGDDSRQASPLPDSPNPN